MSNFRRHLGILLAWPSGLFNRPINFFDGGPFMFARGRTFKSAQLGSLLLLFWLVLLPDPLLSAEFYKDKTIQLIVPYPPGGDNDVISRLVGRKIGDYIPGNPNVIVQNMPGAGGIIALNHAYNVSKPDGLTIVSLASAAIRHQLVGVETVKFDFNNFEFLGNAGPLIQVFVVNSRLAYTSMGDLKKAKTPIAIAGGAAGSTSSVVANILAKEGYNVKLITGYPGAVDRMQAMRRNEASASTIGWIQLHQYKEEFRPLMWAGAKGPEWTHLPSIEELDLSQSTRSFIKAFTVPMDAGRSFAMPPKTPRAAVEVLQKALEQTVKDSSFKAEATKMQVDIGWTGAEQTKSMFLQVLKTPRTSIEEMKETLQISK
jgi:tripartite-type tricarboxylate transporter receptor subunit TctC